MFPHPIQGRNWGGDRKGDEREIMKGEGEKEEQWEEPVNDICQPFTPPPVNDILVKQPSDE